MHRHLFPTTSFAFLLSFLGATGIRVVAATEAANNLPDKSQYNWFNPTPDQYLRALSADRPDKTDSPFTVDAGHFQVEIDFANLTYNGANSERGNVRFTAIEAAPMNIKVGLFNDLDFQLVYTPYRWEKTEDRDSGILERKLSFDEITPRFKVNLIGNDGGFFSLALIPFVTVPTSQHHQENSSVECGLGIPFAFDIPGWDVGFQTTVHFKRNQAGEGHHTELDNSISIGHSLVGKLSLSAEFFSSVSTERGGGRIGTVDTWLTYQVNAIVRFDGGVYIGVTQAADDWHPWLGMTRRF